MLADDTKFVSVDGKQLSAEITYRLVAFSAGIIWIYPVHAGRIGADKYPDPVYIIVIRHHL